MNEMKGLHLEPKSTWTFLCIQLVYNASDISMNA